MKLLDIGKAEITIEETAVSLDVVQVNNQLAEIQEKHKENASTGNEAVLDYMVELGFPRCTHYIACAFAAAMADRMNDLKESLKNVASGGPKVGSPASTASTPSSLPNLKS
jgi:hypothetical protein